jgi:hypothetical protein
MAAVLTNVGEEWACHLMAGDGSADANHGKFVGWGTGSAAPAKGDTTLQTESAESRAIGTVTVAGSGSSAKYQVVGTLTSSSGQTIAEAGNFSAAGAGTLVVRGTFTGVVLNIGDAIQFTIQIDPS